MAREDDWRETLLYYEDYHFALLSTLMFNINRDPQKTRAASVKDFMLSPPAEPEKRKMTPEEIRALFKA